MVPHADIVVVWEDGREVAWVPADRASGPPVAAPPIGDLHPLVPSTERRWVWSLAQLLWVTFSPEYDVAWDVPARDHVRLDLAPSSPYVPGARVGDRVVVASAVPLVAGDVTAHVAEPMPSWTSLRGSGSPRRAADDVPGRRPAGARAVVAGRPAAPRGAPSRHPPPAGRRPGRAGVGHRRPPP